MKTAWLPKDMAIPPRLSRKITPQRIDPKHILFINPFYRKDPLASFGKHVLTPSLALTSLAGATPPDWTVQYWDENLLQGPPPWNPFPRIVGITVHLTFAKRAYELSQWYRERGAIVILGGLHVQSCPEEAAPHADAIAVGNGVEVWPRILEDIEKGVLKKEYSGCYSRGFDTEPVPCREVLPKGSFLTASSLIASRGCSNRCGFCYLSTRGLSIPKATRNPESVVAEFLSTGESYGVFVDNNLGVDLPYLFDLCSALEPAKRIWSAAVSIDATDDPALVRKMALAGCTGVFVGFESLTYRNLRDMGKRTPQARDYARRVQIFHDVGIQVNGSFVFGFDHDRKDVFERTLDWIESVKLECATFHILTPYPGTPLFQRMEREGRLLHKNWDLYDTSHAVFKPRHMSPAELEAGYARCYEKLFSHASIWRRMPKGFSAALSYLFMAYLYKRSNRLWYHIIRRGRTTKVWRPLVEMSRRNHLWHRKKLARKWKNQAMCLSENSGRAPLGSSPLAKER